MLALWLDRSRTIEVGSLGQIHFPAGWTLYVGSARGPGGLEARLARHRQKVRAGKRRHWHVDSLREEAVWAGAWGRAGEEAAECEWAARLLSLPDAQLVARGFGSSDCRCPGHLVHVPALPQEGWLRRALGAQRIRVGDGELDELLQLLLTGDDESREAAAIALGRAGAPAVEALAPLLVHGEAAARWWATRALAEVERPAATAAVGPLLGALSDPDPDVRACAALALGHVGDGSAARALARCLADESAFVASVASDALTMLGEASVPALVEMLGEGRPYVRVLAARALERTKSQAAIGPLCELLEDTSYLVRYYAQEALDNLGVGFVYVRP